MGVLIFQVSLGVAAVFALLFPIIVFFILSSAAQQRDNYEK
jgi:hypothetical protein